MNRRKAVADRVRLWCSKQKDYNKLEILISLCSYYFIHTPSQAIRTSKVLKMMFRT